MFSFWFFNQTEYSIRFTIKRKTVATLIFLAIWKESEIFFCEAFARYFYCGNWRGKTTPNFFFPCSFPRVWRLSRHQGGLIQGPLCHHSTAVLRGFRGCPQMGAHYAERRMSLGQPIYFFQSNLRAWSGPCGRNFFLLFFFLFFCIFLLTAKIIWSCWQFPFDCEPNEILSDSG